MANKKTAKKITKPQQAPKPNPLKDYYIAYIDILGYVQFFKEYPEKVADFLNDIHTVVNQVALQTNQLNAVVNMIEAPFEFKYKIFSDNFLFCLEALDKSELPKDFDRILFLWYLKMVAEIQAMFVTKYGLLVRGGVTKGQLSFNDDYIFGQGLVDAVNLEKKAQFPRIIVDESLYHMLAARDLPKECEGKNCGKFEHAKSIENMVTALGKTVLSLDNDKLVHLSYLDEDNPIFDAMAIFGLDIKSMLGLVSQITQVPDCLPPKFLEIINGIISNLNAEELNRKAFCLERLKAHRGEIVAMVKQKCDKIPVDYKANYRELQKIICKYKWVLDYHNWICDRFNHLDLSIVYKVEIVALMRYDAEPLFCIKILDEQDNGEVADGKK